MFLFYSYTFSCSPLFNQYLKTFEHVFFCLFVFFFNLSFFLLRKQLCRQRLGYLETSSAHDSLANNLNIFGCVALPTRIPAMNGRTGGRFKAFREPGKYGTTGGWKEFKRQICLREKDLYCRKKEGRCGNMPGVMLCV